MPHTRPILGNSYNVFRALIGSGILRNVNEAVKKKIVLKTFEKGNLDFVRYIQKNGFLNLFKEGELKNYIMDENSSLRKSLGSTIYNRRKAISIVRTMLSNSHISKSEIKDLCTELGIE